MRYKTFSFRYADQILNSKLSIKDEILDIIEEINLNDFEITRQNLNKVFEEKLINKGWNTQPVIFEDPKDPGAKLDFLKERIGIEVQFGHPSFIGIDLLKFQTLSYSNPNLDKIDVGVYILTTRSFQKIFIQKGFKWNGSLPFEKVKKYLPHFRSAIQVPIFVIGLDE